MHYIKSMCMSLAEGEPGTLKEEHKVHRNKWIYMGKRTDVLKKNEND